MRLTYDTVQEFLDAHVLKKMVGFSGCFGPLETCWHISNFTNEWISREMVRAILRSLTDRGYCYYSKGLFTEDGELAGSGYGLTERGLAYCSELRSIPTPENPTPLDQSR